MLDFVGFHSAECSQCFSMKQVPAHQETSTTMIFHFWATDWRFCRKSSCQLFLCYSYGRKSYCHLTSLGFQLPSCLLIQKCSSPSCGEHLERRDMNSHYWKGMFQNSLFYKLQPHLALILVYHLTFNPQNRLTQIHRCIGQSAPLLQELA